MIHDSPCLRAGIVQSTNERERSSRWRLKPPVKTQVLCGQSLTQVAGEEIERFQMKKSMSGYAYYEGPGQEAYDDKCHIEYFSETHAKWPLGGG